MPDAPRCPLCAVALAPFATEEGVALDQCPRCQRLWFDRGELARVLGTPDDLDAPVSDDLPMIGHEPDTCPRCANVYMNRVPFRAGEQFFVDRCPYCAGVWAPLSALGAMREIVRSTRAFRAPATAPGPTPAAHDPDVFEVPELSLKATIITLPAAFCASALWRVIPLSKIVPGGILTPIHELGHATASWLTSVPAVPIPMGLTLHADGRSALAWVAMQAGFAVTAFASFKRRAFGWTAAALALLLAHDALTFTLSPARREAWFLWAGGAGEMAFAALPLVLFHMRLAPRLRWDMARWMALPIGSFLLLDRAIFWRLCLHDRDMIPWGAAFSEDESDGDLTRLVEHHAWGTVMIVRRYINLSTLCFALIFVAWLYALLTAWRRERVQAPGRAR